mmetsp:Transcript_17821/g.26534  ORF Transcript_17821/g.26534 Transcript_17821/m.26534 type:complete len:143 (+) Transcript_17821:1096-1524(+)
MSNKTDNKNLIKLSKVLSESELDAQLKASANLAKEQKVPFFVIASSDWCPDCIKTKQPLEDALDALKDPPVVLFLDVGERSVWRDFDHPYRNHPLLELDRIPTLYHIAYTSEEKLTVVSTLVEDKCYRPASGLVDFLQKPYQ